MKRNLTPRHRGLTIRRSLAVLALGLAMAVPAAAAVQTKTLRYQHGDAELVGHLAWDDAAQGKRPGILVVHEWWGLNEHAKKAAERLAEAGYVGFALDMYGGGRATTHPEEAGQWSGAMREDPGNARARFEAAVKTLQSDEHVDPDRVAAIGYCFGGGVVLRMAQAGLDLDAVASFHGALPTDPVPAGTRVAAQVLVLHGAADTFVTPEDLAAFQRNMTAAGADWQLVAYGGAIHSFTNPDAGSYGMEGLAYDEKADRRSWRALMDFLEEVFGGP